MLCVVQKLKILIPSIYSIFLSVLAALMLETTESWGVCSSASQSQAEFITPKTHTH